MPLKAELDAIKKNYVKLMKLPVSELLPALKAVDVVSDDQREKMKAMTLDKERAGYLLDNVIIPTLKVDIREPFYNFLETLEQDENVVVKAVAKDLRSLLGPPMPQPGQPFPPQPQYNPYGGQPPNPYGGQLPNPYGGQPPNPYGGQQPNPYGGQPPNPYGGQPPNPYGGQQPNPYGGQQPNPYGGQPPNPYGGQPPNPYGGQQPNPYGGQPPNPYSGQPPNPYGGQPPNPYSGPGYSQAPHLIEVEKVLAKSSKKGIDPLPANNRNVHAVCLIKRQTADGIELGTGFIASLTMPAGLITVLVTNHHVIHNLNEALDATYQFSYIRSDSVDTPDPISGTDLIPANDEGFSTCMEIDKEDVLLDYTLMQVRERPLNDIIIKSELDGETFPLSTCKFDLDNPASPSGIEGMETVTILHYPQGLPLKRSTQGSTSVGHLLFYSCDTDGGSSGAPVFKVANKRLQVLALHRGSWEGVKFNFGTLITEVLRHAKRGPAARMNKWAVLNELQHRVK